LDQLEAGRRRPLTLVSTSAGYGKSALVGQWLEAGDWPSDWLSLDEYDNDLVLFLSYLLAFIQTSLPDACDGRHHCLVVGTVGMYVKV
jgi:LuxR family maltose regulon positive regulatory protein